jgi:hypothetical protein
MFLQKGGFYRVSYPGLAYYRSPLTPERSFEILISDMCIFVRMRSNTVQA